MHPHSKTDSELLSPTIDSLLSSLHQSSRFSISGSVNSFQSIGSDSFNIIPDFFEKISNLNSTSNPQISKKHTIESLSNEEDYNEIKRRKVINNEDNCLSDEAGTALAMALSNNITLMYLNLRNNQLSNKAGKALAEALCKNASLANLDLSHNELGESAEKSLAEALCKNTS
ncbi:Protein NLRC3 [Gigaspora margarita]|uniref:Protein NLRC3 n=1 Tax=Gigaspora margarita TaxID=4874 RepID=A0A8H4ETX2_GIGMA|nr:Protein NLRC3 [Gigaspora margarita]